MNINTDNAVSLAEASQNFSKVASMADLKGSVIIMKNNVPHYVLMEYGQTEPEQPAHNKDLFEISRKMIDRNRKAYEVLAK